MWSGTCSPGSSTSGNSKIGSSRPAIPADSRMLCEVAPSDERGATRLVAGIDFEAEGLLGDLTGKAREARLALLADLTEAGVPLDELKRAVEENRLVLLPVERVFDSGTESYTSRQIAQEAGLEHDFLLRLLRALGASIPEDDQAVYSDADLEAPRRAKLSLDAGL